jgi:hypothetical protein
MVKKRLYRSAALIVIPLLWTSTGCNHGSAMVPVRGKVTNKDGSLITRGVPEIRFEPAQDTTAVMRKTAIGKIQKDGSFELFTRKPGDGVMPGKYNVVISDVRDVHDPVQLIDLKYTTSATTPYHETIDGERTDLMYTVEPAGGTASTPPPAPQSGSASSGASG